MAWMSRASGLVLILVLLVHTAFASFTIQEQLYYTGTSTAPGTLYQDAIGSNADVGIEICGFGSGRYVGATYAANIAGAWSYELISYRTSSDALTEANTNLGGGCYSTIPGFLTVSPSSLSTPSPNVQKAALPGRLYVGHSTSTNPGVISQFEFGGDQMRLRGDYTIQRSFDQSTLAITAQTPTVQFQTSSGTFTKSATDAQFGVAADRPLIMAVCTDEDGQSCSAGSSITSDVFPYSMSTDLSAGQVNDQTTHTRYVVANGLGKTVCIGANLLASVTSVDPDPVYYSQNLEVNFTTTNYRDTPFEILGGNVDVTTPFDIRVRIHNASDASQVIYDQTQTINQLITPGDIVSLTLNWPAFAHSGIYTVLIDTDANDDIAECNEGDNSASANFELRPITLPEIFIDGVETSEFPYPNAPFNLSFYLKNSDNKTLSNATVRMVETNGLTVLAPTQIYNRTIDAANTTTPDGLRSNTSIMFRTDYSGEATFYFMPTYNKLYLPQYNYTDLENYIGGYALLMAGVQEDGEQFTFVIDGNLTQEYPFTIADPAFQGPYPAKIIARKEIISQVLDFVYHSYTAFLETVLGS
jgi:hypothetical protein